MVARETSIAAGLTSLGILTALGDPDEAVRRLTRFAQILVGRGRSLGLIGPGEGDRVVQRHILDSAALFPHLRPQGLLIDVGSGAGLPGVVLAVLRDAEVAGGPRSRMSQASTSTDKPAPDESFRGFQGGPSIDSKPGRFEFARVDDGRDRESSPDDDDVTAGRVHNLPVFLEHGRLGGDAGESAAFRSRGVMLIEPKARAVSFLRSIVAEIGIGADVIAGRSEDVARSPLRERAAAVTARAVAPPNVALELTLPLTAVGGRTLILAPTVDEAGLRVARRAAEELGGSAPVLVPLEVPGAEAPRWVIMVEKIRSTPERYPRRPASLRRRPLGGGRVN